MYIGNKGENMKLIITRLNNKLKDLNSPLIEVIGDRYIIENTLLNYLYHNNIDLLDDMFEEACSNTNKFIELKSPCEIGIYNI